MPLVRAYALHIATRTEEETAMSAIDVDQLLTGEQVADQLGVSRQRVQQLAGRADFPPPAGKIGKATVWRAGDIADYRRGLRAFVTINGVGLGTEEARALADRLMSTVVMTAKYPAPMNAQIAAKLQPAIATGGRVHLTDVEAMAVRSAIDDWIMQAGPSVVGDRITMLRYRLGSEVERTVGNVNLVARSLTIQGQPDEESDYIVSAYVIGGHLASPPIRLTKPGSARAALDAASRHPWVVAHLGV